MVADRVDRGCLVNAEASPDFAHCTFALRNCVYRSDVRALAPARNLRQCFSTERFLEPRQPSQLRVELFLSAAVLAQQQL